MVARGPLIKRKTFIPLDAVAKTGDGQVFINVPRLFVSKMPWDEPPSIETEQSKLGPPSAHARLPVTPPGRRD